MSSRTLAQMLMSSLSILALGAAGCSGGSGKGGGGGTVGTGGQAGTGTGGGGAAGAGGQACGNPDGGVVVDDGPPPVNAAVTAVGSQTTPPSTAAIGPAGGAVTSADQRLQITIPAGALCAATTIGIANITNTAPGGIGSAYRLTPDGQTFAVPVTLTFKPGDELDTDPLQVRLAFQRTGGAWELLQLTAVDDPTVVTYTSTATHFSDYSYVALMQLIGPTELVVGQTASLQITQFDLASAGNLYLTADPQPYSGTNAPSWTINGMPSGSIDSDAPYGYVVSDNGPDAVYTAPAQLPSSGNPVAVTVRISYGANFMYTLVKNIQLLADQ
jgi:hypothetical protein